MTDDLPSPASQRRQLLPRWPSDRVVLAMIVLGGVERAFVMESTAISFYVLACALAVVGALQATGLLQRIDAVWFAVAAMFIDTAVRSARESRFA
jgi:hypothetical protein